MYLWVCAIAVCEQPTWELSIAIGQALQSKGVEVTFDNLSILARIPWLQSGDLHPRLRKDLINQLDPQTERLARAAVKKELELVKGLTSNGHANRALNTNLAIQNFAMAPESHDHQQTIRYLLSNGLLSKKQIAELNHTVERHEGEKATLQKVRKATDKGMIQQFLSENEAVQEPLPKPFFTPHLIRACALGLLFLVFLFGLIKLKTKRQKFD